MRCIMSLHYQQQQLLYSTNLKLSPFRSPLQTFWNFLSSTLVFKTDVFNPVLPLFNVLFGCLPLCVHVIYWHWGYMCAQSFVDSVCVCLWSCECMCIHHTLCECMYFYATACCANTCVASYSWSFNVLCSIPMRIPIYVCVMCLNTSLCIRACAHVSVQAIQWMCVHVCFKILLYWRS